jgi:GNAT superfamily N-acetyltransferase
MHSFIILELSMLTIEKIDTSKKLEVKRFIRIPFRLYADHPQWVPPILVDREKQLNREEHPFYEHSEGDFFIAVRDRQDVGSLAVFENRTYNDYHGTKQAQFYFFESEDDQEVANALFERAFDWARKRGLNAIVGPKGLGALDGYGMLVQGFEHRQMMTMMNYNYPYYPQLVEALGFEKVVDFVSSYIYTADFNLPERVHRIAERVQKRGTLRVQRFKNKRELVAWSDRIGKAYNQAFVNNWEYFPLTEREIKFVVDSILTIANPRLMKIMVHDEDVVGFLLGFPDISAAIQRSKGRLLPLGIIDMLLEMRRTDKISLNGVGILPEFQGHGGNALMYSEMEKTVKDFGFEHAELTQVAETAVTMRKDLENVGANYYKNHRVYVREL